MPYAFHLSRVSSERPDHVIPDRDSRYYHSNKNDGDTTKYYTHVEAIKIHPPIIYHPHPPVKIDIINVPPMLTMVILNLLNCYFWAINIMYVFIHYNLVR